MTLVQCSRLACCMSRVLRLLASKPDSQAQLPLRVCCHLRDGGMHACMLLFVCPRRKRSLWDWLDAVDCVSEVAHVCGSK